MLFNSFNFWLVFPLIFIIYWSIPSKYNSARNRCLLMISYLIYMNWKPAFAIALLGITLITYIGALVITDKKESRKKLLCWFFTLTSLLPLLIFKYYNFLNDNITRVLQECNLHITLPGLNIAIPIGISFFTFQAVGYLLDVYHKKIQAEKNFWNYAIFVSFFPQIISGPISTAKDLMPQFKTAHQFNYTQAREGLQILLWGMFLKVAFADRLGIYVDAVYNEYEYYNGISCLIASVFYSFQIYGDFAGYSLMAMGISKLLGFNLINNFNRPYFASSITDFWKRWHISLTRWLTTHIYINLGGNRCSKARQYSNIMITFLVSGLWHGANWTFIIWGVIHGFLQILEKILGLDPKGKKKSILPNSQIVILRPIRIISTFILINFAWIFFRMPSISDAANVITKILTLSPGVQQNISFPAIHLLLFMIVFITEISIEYNLKFKQLFERKLIIRWTCYLLLFCLTITYGILDSGQFIYVSF